MTLRKLPKINVGVRPDNLHWDAPADVLAKWADTPQAAVSSGDNVITMFEVIGQDLMTGGGVTAKRVSAALRAIGNNDVIVKINSPGGDVFEGIAIYNILRDHSAKVTVEIVGWAASAASVIAMSGDEIRMGLGTFFMIHNSWGMVIGNRHDLRTAADVFEGIDAGLVDIYMARTGGTRAEIAALMDSETFIDPKHAKDLGFVDVIDEAIAEAKSAVNAEEKTAIHARRQIEAAMAKAGYSRRDRSQMLAEIVDDTVAQRDASHHTSAARDAGTIAAFQQLINSMKN